MAAKHLRTADAASAYVGAMEAARRELRRIMLAIDAAQESRDPDETTWGEVGDMAKVAADLRDLADFLIGPDLGEDS